MTDPDLVDVLAGLADDDRRVLSDNQAPHLNLLGSSIAAITEQGTRAIKVSLSSRGQEERERSTGTHASAAGGGRVLEEGAESAGAVVVEVVLMAGGGRADEQGDEGKSQ